MVSYGGDIGNRCLCGWDFGLIVSVKNGVFTIKGVKMSLKEKVKELETWVKNISDVQNQLLKELGYEVKWKQLHDCNIYISKIDKSRTTEEGVKKVAD